MARVRTRNTAPEVALRRALFAAGALALEGAQPAGMFIDWRYVSPGEADGPSEGVLAQLLHNLGSIAGDLVQARAYGVDAQRPIVDFTTGWLGAERVAPERLVDPLVALAADLRSLLDAADGPRTWVIAADARALEPHLRTAREQGTRVVLWSRDGAAHPEADAWMDLGPLLRGLAAPNAELLRPRAAPPELRAEEVGDASQSIWVRLAYHVECYLRQAKSASASANRIAEALAWVDEFGPSASEAASWLQRAVEAGVLQPVGERATGQGAGDQSLRLNPGNRCARAAIDVPERCLSLLNQMLQRMPWVSFKLLRGVLAREQWLGGPAFQLDETRIDEWVNFLIREGAMQMTKEPNLINPEFPVTALRVNPAHAFTAVVATPEGGTDRLSKERAILTVHHFLTRQRKPWMSMGALRRALDSLSREQLQEVLRSLQTSGSLLTERYPNPQRDQPTTGCRLNPEDPFVGQTLETRDGIICTAAEIAADGEWRPVGMLEAALNSSALPVSLRQPWLLLLADEGVIELTQGLEAVQDPESAGGRSGIHDWDAARFRLNYTDAIVSALARPPALPPELAPPPSSGGTSVTSGTPVFRSISRSKSPDTASETASVS